MQRPTMLVLLLLLCFLTSEDRSCSYEQDPPPNALSQQRTDKQRLARTERLARQVAKREREVQEQERRLDLKRFELRQFRAQFKAGTTMSEPSKPTLLQALNSTQVFLNQGAEGGFHGGDRVLFVYRTPTAVAITGMGAVESIYPKGARVILLHKYKGLAPENEVLNLETEALSLITLENR